MSTADLPTAYLKEKRNLCRERARLLILFGIVLIPSFILLDYYTFPEHFESFLKLRVFITLFILLLSILISSLKNLSYALINLLAFLASLAVAATIAHMCGMLGGYASPYYTGILLVMLATGLVMPWSASHTALNGIFCYLAYIGLAYTPEASWESLLNNSYFLISTTLMSTASTYYSNRSRYQEFLLRQELQDKNEALISLDKAKNRFFANLTHEFRTPLVSLSTALQMIQEKLKLDEELAALLHSSHLSLTEMLENINDLLTKTKSESATLKMHWSEIDIVSLSQQSLRGFEPVAKQKGLKLIFENHLEKYFSQNNNISSEKKLYGDISKIRKILNNLLSNATKFTKAGQIKLSLSIKGKYISIKISDTGMGIPKTELEDIFEAFTQASNNSFRDVKGSGLGLSIVKDFVKAHHGRTQTNSQLEKGSQFTVKLPLGTAHLQGQTINPQQNPPTSPPMIFESDAILVEPHLLNTQTPQPNKAQILVVEDTIQVAQALRFLLKEEYNLLFAQDGEEAITQLKSHPIDLIISDIMMPKKDGYELLQELKQDPHYKKIPFILLTSKTDLESKVSGFKHGADEYISKPFHNIEVITRVKNLLEQRKMQAEFVHAEKMIALGQLVAGISHEILNPISYAKNAAENIPDFLKAIDQKTLPASEGRKHLMAAAASVSDGIQRVCDITKALNGFARQNQEHYQKQDIHIGIESTLKILHSQPMDHINIHRHFTLKEPVECKLNQLNQVFLNLLINAVHALENQKQGNLWIKTSLQQDQAKISIRDDGPGIASEVHDRVFNPFFTTKDVGEGSGLGLYISQQIVHEHGGRLYFETAMGKGTEFTISIPLEQRGSVRDRKQNYTHSHTDQRMAQIQYPHRR